MKKNTIWFNFFIILFIVGGISVVSAQERIIEPTEGFVNEVIKADTLAGGVQAHNTYVFRRGGQYYVNGQISNVGFAITLKGEAGSGKLPKISNWPDGAGTLNRILDAADDAYVYDLYLDGMGPNLTTGQPDPYYGMNGQLLRAAAAGKVLVIDGCVLNNASQTIIRSNSGARKVQVTNTTLANSGQLSKDNLGNGRIIDFRNGITDTVIFKNCTMVNTYDRIIRHYGAAANSETAYIKYFEFDHNTVVHNTGAYGFIFLGDVSGGVKITNNLLYNPMTLGVDTADHQRFVEVAAISEVGADGRPVFPLIIEQTNTLYNPTYVMSNNVIAYDQAVKNYMTTNGVQPAPALAPRLAALVTGTNPFVTADVTLKNIPNVMMDVMTWYRPLALTSLGGGMITSATLDMDRRDADYMIGTLDCSYTTGNAAFKGSDGKPVGSNVWNSVVNATQVSERILEPTEGFVNEVIKADTLAGGVQAHNTYVFRRGGQYYVNGQISNVGFAITLKGEAGSGKLPKISNWPDGAGTLNRILDAADDAYVYDLYLDGMGPNLTTGQPDPYYGMNGQLLRAAAAGKVLVIDGCVLNNASQTIIRSNSGARKVQVTNTTLANSGQLSKDNLGNGRIIDFRNGITDTVIFKNCTMVNTYDRIIRHYGAAANSETAYIKYFEFDHNTVVHNTGAYGFIFLGDVSGGVKITNNLLYNPMTLGVDTADHQRFVEVAAISEVGADGRPVFPLIIEQTNTLYNPTYVMSNNVIAYDQAVKNYMTTNGVQPAPALAPRLAALVTGTNPFVTADVTLKNIPNVMMDVMTWYRPLALTSLGGGMITSATLDMDRRDADYMIGTLDCSYTTGNAAFKGSDGKPVGSNVWSSVLTDVNDVSIIPAEYSLSNNYPNPFNPSTKIQFSIPERSNVMLVVYNMLGQEVSRIVDQTLAAGSHSFNFNAAGLGSGVYIYKLYAVGESGKNFMASHKMTLLK